MNYPNGPYGQGFQGQQGYPQQGGYQPGYPAYQPPPMPPASPGGGTAITAGTLALLGGLLHGGLGVLTLLSFISRAADDSSGELPFFGFAIMSISAIGGLLILAGGVMLLSSKMASRWLIALGCVLIFAFAVMALLAANALGQGGLRAVSYPGLVFPVVTLVLTFLPSTTRWIQAKRNPVAPQYYPYYPYYPPRPPYPG